MDEDEEGLREPYEPNVAHRLIREALQRHRTIWSDHLFASMEERDVSPMEVENALRAGVPQPAELINGTWRYPICTSRLRVIAAFRSPTRVAIITVIRLI